MALPDTIYIQIDQDGDPLTFCPTRVNDDDRAYIRADIADEAFATWEKAIQELRALVKEACAPAGKDTREEPK